MDDHNAHSKDNAKEDDIESGEEDEPVSQQPLVSSTGRKTVKLSQSATLMERIVAVSADMH